MLWDHLETLDVVIVTLYSGVCVYYQSVSVLVLSTIEPVC